MSNLYIHNGNEWCDVCSNTAKIKVPSGDWVQIGKGSEINKYYNGTEWVILECPNECPDVTIGSQIWTRCNLGVTTYRNGDVIPQVTDPTEWVSLTTGAWSYYNNDPLTEPLYGKLYNWYAINDPRGLAPTGYHVPSDTEWTTLTDYLGGDSVAGGKMKEAGLNHWLAPNTDATNMSLFSALPGGYRYFNGDYNDIGYYGGWWSSTEYSTYSAWSRYLSHDFGDASSYSDSKRDGLSVRLVKGEAPNPDPCPDCISGDITIGTQVWAQCNLNVTTYRNGDVIPQVTDPTAWTALTTGAWCWYNNDSANGPTYGKLYNWYAVNDARGLAPFGYHVPTDTELTTLTDYLGGLTVAGGKMKETGLCHWDSPNTDATNTSLFTGLPGGYRSFAGNHEYIGLGCYLWSSTESNTDNAWYRILLYGYGTVSSFSYKKGYGFSVRVIKD